MFKRKSVSSAASSRKRIIATIAMFSLPIVVGTSVFFYKKTKVGAAGNAVLSLSPANPSINVGDSLTLDVNVDPMGDNIVVTKATLDYDPAILDFTGWDTTGSLFAAGNDCQTDNGGDPCEIIVNDEAEGSVSITLAMPTPGTNVAGLVAKANFIALSPVSGSTGAVVISFAGADDYTDSDVIADDGAGTDLLDSVTGISLTISGTDTTAPTLTPVALANGRVHNRTAIFSSTEPGTLQFGGDCAGFSGNAVAGENRVDFSSLTLGSTHSNCTVQVTDAANNQSAPLTIPEFTVTYRSDIDYSGDVGINDFTGFVEYYKNKNASSLANINDDNSVDINDFTVFAGEYRGSIL